MELIKRYRVVIGIVTAILILVIVRSSGFNHFRNDAKKWAGRSLTHAAEINIEKAASLKGKRLIINLDKDTVQARSLSSAELYIPPDSILSKKYLTIIRNHAGPLIIFSADPGLSARVWMVLSQLGQKNIYILADMTSNEVLNYKFLPDN